MLANQNLRQGALNFAHVARCFAVAKGDRELALAYAEKTNANEGVKIILRSGVPAAAVADVWTVGDAPYAVLAQAFLASLANVGAFDRVALDAVQLPMR